MAVSGSGGCDGPFTSMWKIVSDGSGDGTVTFLMISVPVEGVAVAVAVDVGVLVEVGVGVGGVPAQLAMPLSSVPSIIMTLTTSVDSGGPVMRAPGVVADGGGVEES